MRLICGARQDSPILRLRWAPRGERLISVSADRDEFILWRWRQDRLERIARFGTLREDPRHHGVFTRDAAFHPDGKSFAIVGEGRPIEAYRASDGSLIKRFGEPVLPALIYRPPVPFDGFPWEDPPPSAIFGEFVTMGGRDTRDVAPRHRGYGTVAFSHDGSFVIAGSLVESASLVFDWESSAQIGILPRSDTCLAIHPGGGMAASVRSEYAGSEIQPLELSGPFGEYRPATLSIFDSPMFISGLVFSPSGDALGVVEGWPPCYDWGDSVSLSVLDFPGGSKRFERPVKLPAGLPRWAKTKVTPPVERVMFTPDGLGLIAPSEGGNLAALDAGTGAETGRWRAHDAMIGSLDVCRALGVLASGSWDGDIKVWELET